VSASDPCRALAWFPSSDMIEGALTFALECATFEKPWLPYDQGLVKDKEYTSTC
jgi:hypothetical protein